jgi:hypothetical protein
LAQLAGDAGLSLIHLALAFVMQHPTVTAPITAHPRPSEVPARGGRRHGVDRRARQDRAAGIHDLPRRARLCSTPADRSVPEAPPHHLTDISRIGLAPPSRDAFPYPCPKAPSADGTTLKLLQSVADVGHVALQAGEAAASLDRFAVEVMHDV